MLSSAIHDVALWWLVAAQICFAAQPVHGGHGGPAQAYRQPTPQWQRSFANASTGGGVSTPFTPTAVSAATATKTSGASLASGTVNAVGAVLKYWWTARASEPASTVQILFNPEDDKSTGWTVYSASTRLNLNYAVTKKVCGKPTITLTYSDLTFTPTNCDTKIPRVASSTSGVYVTAYKKPTATTGYMTPIPDLRVTSPPAHATVGSTIIGAGTAFVQFSKYEIIKCQRSGQCQTSTYQLSAPYAFRYSGPDPTNSTNATSIVTGKLDPAFPAYIQDTSLTAGDWTGPTVIVVVVEYVIVAVAVLAATASVEGTATKLIVPTPVLPSGFSQVAPQPVTTPKTIAATARVEQTQTFLLVPLPPAPATTPDRQGAVVTFPVIPTGCAANCPAPAHDIVVDGTTLSPTAVPYYVADGRTIHIGESASMSDCIASAPAANTLLMICGSQTSTLALPESGVITTNGWTVTAGSGSGYIVPGGRTIFAGGPGITIGGMPVSVAPGSGGLQIGGSMQTSPSATTITASNGSPTDSSPPASSTTKNAGTSDALLSTTLTLSACAMLGWLWVVG